MHFMPCTTAYTQCCSCYTLSTLPILTQQHFYSCPLNYFNLLSRNFHIGYFCNIFHYPAPNLKASIAVYLTSLSSDLQSHNCIILLVFTFTRSLLLLFWPAPFRSTVWIAFTLTLTTPVNRLTNFTCFLWFLSSSFCLYVPYMTVDIFSKKLRQYRQRSALRNGTGLARETTIFVLLGHVAMQCFT